MARDRAGGRMGARVELHCRVLACLLGFSINVVQSGRVSSQHWWLCADELLLAAPSTQH